MCSHAAQPVAEAAGFVAQRTRPFRFGVFGLGPGSGAEWAEQLHAAEDLGYCSFFVPDHYIGPGPALDPTRHSVQNFAAIPALAFAAAVTTSIRIGPRVMCVDYRNPSVLAKELATIDVLSSGRLDVGLGAGWLDREYAAMGIPFDPASVRIDRLEQVVGLVTSAMSGEVLDIADKYVQAGGFRAVPARCNDRTLRF